MICHQPITKHRHVLLEFLKVYHFYSSKIMMGQLLTFLNLVIIKQILFCYTIVEMHQLSHMDIFFKHQTLDVFASFGGKITSSRSISSPCKKAVFILIGFIFQSL